MYNVGGLSCNMLMCIVEGCLGVCLLHLTALVCSMGGPCIVDGPLQLLIPLCPYGIWPR